MNGKLKNSFKNMWSWMTSSSNPITRLWNDYTGNTSIDKQLAHQQAENEATREYNLQLAEKQNNWNIQQWQRENEYNSPSAQKARLEAAGLNPDLMYGAGGVMNTSASSPQMTAGAPASPTDWTSLGRKKTIGESVMEGLAVAQARANVKKTEGEAKQLGMTNDIRQSMIDKGMIIEESEYEKLREDINYVQQIARGIDYDNTTKEVEHSFTQLYRDKLISNKLEKLEASTKMTQNQLKEDIETLTLRIAGANAENSKLVRLSDFTTDEKRLVFDIIKELLRVML